MEVLLNQSKVAVDAANEIINDNKLQQEALAESATNLSSIAEKLNNEIAFFK